MHRSADQDLVERLLPTEFSSLPGWEADDHLAALDAFCLTAKQMLKLPYPSSPLNFEGQTLVKCAQHALSLNSPSPASAKSFFENWFLPHRFEPAKSSEGFVTGYFEPELQASLQPTDQFSVPLHRRPNDLIDLDDHNRPPEIDPSFLYGREHNGKVSEYFDRAAIQAGALKGRGLELVWLNDKTDAFFVHVQGSARLALPDNSTMRVGFAAKSGHPYSSLGKILCDQKGIPVEEMTADRLADWMRNHPEKIDQLMGQNRSYIFFQTREDAKDVTTGPVGAADVPLTAGRSLAIDPTIHSYGLPIWVSAADDLLGEIKSFSRLMVAQDTGSAIKGEQRGDIFVGSGSEAGFCAGKIRSPASFTILVPSA